MFGVPQTLNNIALFRLPLATKTTLSACVPPVCAALSPSRGRFSALCLRRCRQDRAALRAADRVPRAGREVEQPGRGGRGDGGWRRRSARLLLPHELASCWSSFLNLKYMDAVILLGVTQASLLSTRQYEYTQARAGYSSAAEISLSCRLKPGLGPTIGRAARISASACG